MDINGMRSRTTSALFWTTLWPATGGVHLSTSAAKLSSKNNAPPLVYIRGSHIQLHMGRGPGQELIRLYLKYKEIIFPSGCLLCGRSLLFRNEKGTEICNHCYTLLTPLKGKCCEKCSLPLISEQGICLRCREQSYHFKKHISLFHYKGAIKELIYFYKFKQKRTLAFLFSRFIIDKITAMFPHFPIIPVPSRKQLFKKQGWDHLAPIAKVLKRDFKKKIINCLIRKGDIPQKKLSFRERVKNLQGKIHVKKGIQIQNKEVLLLDDIFTTGATADECSRVLLAGGARSIYVITIAID